MDEREDEGVIIIFDINGIKGAFVSFGNFVRIPVKNNVLLVGDAVSSVD